MPLLYADITKADERIASGIASTDAIDGQPGVMDGQAYIGDVVDPRAIEGALTDYLEWANVREMHQASAVGTAIQAEVKDGQLWLAVKVIDDAAWEKVKAGVYKGFSIGGRIIKAVLEKLPDGRYVRRILQLALTEISLVDRPANPDAKILLFKLEAPMPQEIVPEQPAAPAALTSDQIAALQKLAGNLATLQPEALIKAAADPAKIVSLIQQSRNDLELAGDMQGAALLTQAIALIQQATGEAEDPAEEVAAPAEGDAPPEAAMAAGAKIGNLRKAGRALSSANLAGMENTVKTLLQMMAAAGSAKAQKAIAAMADGDEMAMSAKTIGSEFTKAMEPVAAALLNLNDRLSVVERQPAPGGPILRPIAKQIVGQPPSSAAGKPQASQLMREQMDDLLRKANTAPNLALRDQLLKQHAALREQYA
jgi:HK97 family phage prohead protease